jgi:hypothetical protein
MKMGWLYMNSLRGFKSPKAYLEDRFSYENDAKTSIVLRSALVAMRTWYAACEQTTKATGTTEIFVVVCLVDYNPRSKDGHVFGYKDMTEHMGPCEARCPAAILNLLTPTDHQHALDWRKRCRDALQKAQRPSLADGDMIVFAQAIHFADGHEGRRFRVVKHRQRVMFTSPDRSAHYHIRNWKTLDWTVIPKIESRSLAA